MAARDIAVDAFYPSLACLMSHSISFVNSVPLPLPLCSASSSWFSVFSLLSPRCSNFPSSYFFAVLNDIPSLQLLTVFLSRFQYSLPPWCSLVFFQHDTLAWFFFFGGGIPPFFFYLSGYSFFLVRSKVGIRW